MKKIRLLLFVGLFLLAACGKQAQTTLAPVATSIPATATLAPTETRIPDTATPLPPTETPIPISTQDPTVFGAIGTGEIQAGALESVANAIFKKTLDGFVVDGSVQEYQVISLSVFPGNEDLITEIIYSVKTSDPAWLSDGGLQLADGWISNNCSRFDFFTTDTEYQLKNRRLCS
ncbi:MAG: hypothetical protein ABI904_09050 [Chloroflexota bacterium]